MRRIGWVLLIAVVALAGCTGKVSSIYFTLEAGPSEGARLVSTEAMAGMTPLGRLYCNAAEVRPSWLSTLALAACFDAQGKSRS